MIKLLLTMTLFLLAGCQTNSMELLPGPEVDSQTTSEVKVAEEPRKLDVVHPDQFLGTTAPAGLNARPIQEELSNIAKAESKRIVQERIAEEKRLAEEQRIKEENERIAAETAAKEAEAALVAEQSAKEEQQAANSEPVAANTQQKSKSAAPAPKPTQKPKPESKPKAEPKPKEENNSVSYPANSITIGGNTSSWVYWKNVKGSTFWDDKVSSATSQQDAVDKERNRWVNIMTQDNLFSINGSNNLWLASHSYDKAGKQAYHVPSEIIVTDRHGVSAKYIFVDRAKTYNFIGTGTYGNNDVFIQTSLPDGRSIMHYKLSEKLN